MNTAEVDLDRLVDYEREYRSVVKRAQVTGDHMIGLCPFHDDSKNSFSVDLKTGRWHCFSEDIGGNYVDFVAKMNGISTKDAYKRIMEDYHVEMPEKEKPAASRRSYSMEQYAFEKRLPVEFLRDTCHISNDKERKDQTTYMKIPYLKEDGTEATYRKRFAGKEFRWRYGSSGKICLYGEWRLSQMRQSGYACLVEGESDTQSMWYMGISTLGVPGASMFKPNMSDQLQDLKLYIHQEPDQGGETFMRKVIQGLREGGFIGKVYKFSCSTLGGIKDPSDVFIKLGKEEGAAKIQKLLERAEEIDLAEPDVIPESIKGAPVNLRQPEGWIYSDRGISHIDEKTYGPVMVCRTPIILTQRLRSLETGEEKIEIAFKRDDEWHRAIYPRSTIFTARGITVLADLGCTVTSENAKQVVRFYPPWRQRTSTSSRKRMQRPASDGSQGSDSSQDTTKTSFWTSIHHRREWPRRTARQDPSINGKTPCSHTGCVTSSDSSWPQRSQLPCCGSSSKESSLFTTGDPVKAERLPD